MKAQAVMAATGLASSAAASSINILPTPPMGFNNWARFMTNINESIFIDAGVAMSNNGLRTAGYNRLNLDDAWSLLQRDANGSMVADPAKFPSSLPWLTDWMRSNGFKAGIYTDAGSLSCGGYPGALNHEKRDLQDFLRWGFDYLKMDGCNLPNDEEETYHETYSRWASLLSYPKDIAMVFSNSAPAYFSNQKNLTNWYRAMGWASDYGQLARHSADIVTYPNGNGWKSIMFNYGQNLRLARFQRPGFFNDPDFLIPDHPSLTMQEKKSQFALWCSMSSPLLISADIPSLPKETIDFLTNPGLIAVDQDKLAQQATLVSRNATWDVLTRTLANGDRLLTILNRGDSAASVHIPLERAGIDFGAIGDGNVTVQDLWTGRVTYILPGAAPLTIENIPAHGTAVYRLQSISPITPTGAIFNTNSLKCLTDSPSGNVTWDACQGSDAQVWAVHKEDGRVSSLLRPKDCIVPVDGVVKTTSGCVNHHTNPWTYKSSGNLVDNKSGNCLTENIDGTAIAEGCGYLLNQQVLALPAGVPVIMF
ncbi:alpha-N-acetylgalactosaminidase [Metarhizium brunneum]